jgi:hypothetical protein
MLQQQQRQHHHHHYHRFERTIEIYENERMWIGRGFSQAGLLPTDRVGPYSTRDGSLSWMTLDEAMEALLLLRCQGEGGSSNNNNNNDFSNDDSGQIQQQRRQHRGRGWSFHDAEDFDLNAAANEDDDDLYHKTTNNHCRETTSNTVDDDYYVGFDGSKSSIKRIIFTKDYLYHDFAPCIVSPKGDAAASSSNMTDEEDENGLTPSLSTTDEDGCSTIPTFRRVHCHLLAPIGKGAFLFIFNRRPDLSLTERTIK